MDQPTQNVPATPTVPVQEVQSVGEKKNNKKLIVFVTVLILLILLGGLYFLYKNKKIPSKQNVSTAQINAKILSGQILFAENKSLKLLDPKTDTISTIMPLLGLSPTWEYKNNYIFVSTDSAITRYSLVTHESQSIPYHQLGVPSLSPSPDGSKVEVYNAPGYPGDRTPPEVFIYDFAAQKRQDLPSGSGLMAWFGDSQHVLIGKASDIPAPLLPDGSYSGSRKMILYDLADNSEHPIAEGPIYNVTLSQTGFHVLWFQYAVIPNSTNPLGDKAVPAMYTATVDPVKDTISPVSMTPESKFPVVARDFQGISSVLPGKQPNFFFVAMADKKGSVYFTDSYPWGTFKKISPDGPYVYRMLSYNLGIDKVLAYKISDEILKSHPNGINLSQQIVLIDEGSSSEKVITTLNSNHINSVPVFSPDNKFILTPTEAGALSESSYTIFSLQNSQLSLQLKENLGYKFYWIK